MAEECGLFPVVFMYWRNCKRMYVEVVVPFSNESGCKDKNKCIIENVRMNGKEGKANEVV